MRCIRGTLTIAILAATLVACGQDSDPAATPSPVTTIDPTSTPSVVDLTQPIMDAVAGTADAFADLQPGTYAIDPDLDPSTPLRVTWEVATEGWTSWIGTSKFSDAGHVALSVTTVSNLVTDGCTDHSWADPPVGPSVDDLATALTELAPFRVTSPPEEVSIGGYPGTHLELTVPRDQPFANDSFVGCQEGTLKSWVAAIDVGEPGDAFYGYTGAGYTEEIWILDVDGTRLMISTGRSPGSPPKDVAELRTIFDSVRFES